MINKNKKQQNTVSSLLIQMMNETYFESKYFLNKGVK